MLSTFCAFGWLKVKADVNLIHKEPQEALSICHIISSSNMFIFLSLKEAEVHRKSSLFQWIKYTKQANNHIFCRKIPIHKITIPFFFLIFEIKMLDASSSYSSSSM